MRAAVAWIQEFRGSWKGSWPCSTAILAVGRQASCLPFDRHDRARRVYPKLIMRNSGMLPDSWRGHFVRVPAQVKNLRDTSGKMPELRPESDLHLTSENANRFVQIETVTNVPGFWT